MTEAATANIMRQILDGLLYLHSNNILHRDMSLSNLLLTSDLKVKIADFGLATQLSRPDEKHMTMCGTPNYISPEVASRASHGLPADVWGLGCMMYTLLVGRPPFDTDGVKSTLIKVVTSDFIIPPYLSCEAKDLLIRLLCKNPSERIRLEDIFRHPFILRSQLPQNSAPKYNHTLSSTDSGILTTMSSNGTTSQNTTPRILPVRSRSADRFNNNFPLQNQPIQEATHQSSNYGSMHELMGQLSNLQATNFKDDFEEKKEIFRRFGGGSVDLPKAKDNSLYSLKDGGSRCGDDGARIMPTYFSDNILDARQNYDDRNHTKETNLSNFPVYFSDHPENIIVCLKFMFCCIQF